MHTFRKLPVVIAYTMALFGASSVSAQTVSTVQSVGAAGLCIDVAGVALTDGAAVNAWTCNNQKNQSWSIAAAAGGAYQFKAAHSSKCLDVSAASTAVGQALIQWTCNAASTNQQFFVRPQGSGYAVVARHSNLCLGIENDSSVAGARITQQTCNANNTKQTWSIAGLNSRNTVGEWGAVVNVPIVPVAAANLPNGEVLFWSAYDRLGFGGDNGKTYTALYNPSTGTVGETLVTNTGHDMFCPGTANLADGRIHVTGGASSTRTSIYDWKAKTWSTGNAMLQARGYHAATTLSNGDVFLIGGSWSGGVGGKNAEVWSGANGTWRAPSGVPVTPFLTGDTAGAYRADNHAWLFAGENGRVFHAGPSKAMHWVDAAGAGSITNASVRASDQMNGNAVMYAPNSILITGGAPNYEKNEALTSGQVVTLTATGSSAAATGSMAYQRAFHNSVVLPDGKVLVIGGQANPVPFTDDRAPLVPEQWDPATGRFTAMAPMGVPRTYHSVAILLADGRVLSGGGGLCGTCTTNHPNIQLYSPPYLFRADGSLATRPTITQAPATATPGGTFTVTTGAAVSSFSMVRLSSVTHSVNNEQRRFPVASTSAGTNSYSLQMPSRGVAVPGYYMLFAIDAAGVPSVAATVSVN